MTPQQIVGLCVRLLAIYFAYFAIQYLIDVPLTARTIEGQSLHTSYGIGIFCLITAVLFWLFPLVVANKIIPRTRFENHIKIQALETARVGCSLIGLWLFAHMFPGFLWFALRTTVNSSNQSYFDSLNPQEKLQVLFFFIELVVSFVLIFQSHLFAKVVMRNIEHAG